jgi:Flp pilus assembly protein TadG
MRGDRTRERGAALVEFAVLAPLLVFLIFGIIEFGWLFGQYNDIRHAAREGARFAAVDAASAADIAQRVCDTTEGFGAGMDAIDVVVTDGGGEKGDMASIVVTGHIGSLTNVPIITVFTPDALSSDVVFRLEQTASWTSDTLMNTC